MHPSQRAIQNNLPLEDQKMVKHTQYTSRKLINTLHVQNIQHASAKHPLLPISSNSPAILRDWPPIKVKRSTLIL